MLNSSNQFHEYDQNEQKLLELKDSLNANELSSLDVDQKLFKDIVKSMRWLWYESESVKRVLLTYKQPITKEKMPEIIKRIISQL